MLAGLTAYGIPATAEIERRPEGHWGISLDYQPDGMLLEGTTTSATFRVMDFSDNATLGEALDLCAKDAGAALRNAHPGLLRRRRNR